MLKIVSPYYGDPAPPGGKQGQPFSNLWDYEVITYLIDFFLFKSFIITVW